MIEVPITDTFDEPQGRFRNYTAYDQEAAAQLAAQAHIDIRNGDASLWGASYRGLSLDAAPSLYWRLGTDYAGSYSAAVLADGPAFYWRLGESAGTQATDLTGNGRHGVLNNATFGRAGALRGDANTAADLAAGRITLSGYTAFPAGTVRTFECWLNRDSAASLMHIFSNGSEVLRMEGTNDNQVYATWNGGFAPELTNALPYQRWTHVVLVSNDPANTIELFLDGVSTGVKAFVNGFSGAAGLHVGSYDQFNTQSLDGGVDEVAFYEKALTPARIKEHFLRGAGVRDESTAGAHGYPLTGVTLGQPGALTDDADQAVDMTATNGGIACGYKPFVSGSKRSFSGWAWKEGATDGFLFGSDSLTVTQAFVMAYVSGTRFDWHAQVGAGDTSGRWPTAWPGDNQWVHWVLTHDDTAHVAELWINGVSQGVKTLAGTNAYGPAVPGNFMIGRGYGGSSATPWDGKQDEVAVYPSILTPIHIKALYRKGRAQHYTPVNPASVATCQAWFKPESVGQYLESAEVGTWNDSSGNGRHATEATNKPLARQRQVRGYSALDFDGVNDNLTFSGMPTGSVWTVFAIVRGVGNRYLSSGGSLRLGWGAGIPGGPNNYDGVSLAVSQNPNPNDLGYKKVVTSVFNGASSSIRLNGVQVAAGDLGSNASAATWTIGGASVSQPWDGEVVELILYNSVLSAANRDAIEEYLMNKYVIGDIPSMISMPEYRGWRSLAFDLPVGYSEYASVIEADDGTLTKIDLSTSFDNDDEIVLTLPQYPNAAITATDSWIDFTDDPDGAFSPGAVASIKLSDYFENPNYTAEVLADNPALYWRLGETSGTNANDETANNRDGTYNSNTLPGYPGALAGDSNKAALFNNVNGTSISSTYAPFTAGSSVTIEGWTLRNNSVNYDGLVLSSGVNPVELFLFPGTQDLVFRAQGLGSSTSWNNVWPGNGIWVHWALRFNEATDTAELFINGVSKGTRTMADAYGTPGNFGLGGNDAWTGPLDGYMDEVAVYPFILSADRIALRAALGKNVAVRFPRSALNGIDLSSVTGVRLRLATTSPTTLYLSGIRQFSSDWQYSTIDMDTLSGRLAQTIHPSAQLAAPAEFEMPRVWRSADPSSADDPRPIDASIGVVFNSGQATGTNRFTIYFREVIEDYLTQLDLNGMTQTTLEAMHRQPDTGDGKWDPRNLSAFDGLTMADLEGDLMQDLERIADFDLSSWFGITFQWGLDRVIVTGDAEDNGISFEDISPLALDQRYLALFDVEETHFRVRLWPVTTGGVVQYSNLLYDTGHIEDDFLVKRRKGRIGWEIDLDDGAAYIEEIRTRYLNFAEYRSQPFESITPVEGARLFAEFPPDEELFTTLADGTNGGIVTTDTTRANSDQSYKITNTGSVADAGARSNVINFENFDDYQIEFEVWYPQWALDDNIDLKLYLIDDFGNKVALNFGNLSGDTWVHRSITPVEGNASLTGRYYLSWEQPDTGTPTEWWLDNIKVSRRSMRWEARAQLADPWDDVPALWTNFRDKINHQHDGIIFAERGKHLQVRGKALRQNVAMGQVQVVPKYAELGRATVGDQLMAANLAQGSAFDDNAEHVSSLAGLDFGTAKRLDRVSIDFAIAPGFVKLSGSSDGVNYSTILTEEVTKVGWYTFVFNSKPTWRHLRWQKALGGFMNFYRVIVKPYPRNPTAAFTTSAAGFTISFDATTSTDPDGRIIAHAWNFGDGAQGNGQKAAHTYAAPGSYPVTLTVINEFGRAHQITTNVGV